MAKRETQVKPVIDVEAGTVTFQFAGLEPLVMDTSKLHPDIMKRAALHGMAQVRIMDAAAVSMEDEEGNIIPREDRLVTKRERMAKLVEHYHTGTAEWSIRGPGSGGGKSITLEAIARVKDITYDEAKTYVAAYADRAYEGDTREALAFLRDGGKVSAMIDTIRAERRKAPVIDADAALDELK